MFSTLADLFKIAMEIGFFDAILFGLHLKNFPIEETYAMFLTGRISADGVYARLRPRQVKEFVELHEDVKRAFGGDKTVDMPPFITLLLAKGFTENRRRFPFMLPQVDALIERDIEKSISRRKGNKNIVRRDL